MGQDPPASGWYSTQSFLTSPGGSFHVDAVHTPCASPVPNASLMGIPREIREYILEHLLPDIGHVPCRDEQHRNRPSDMIDTLRDALNGRDCNILPGHDPQDIWWLEDNISRRYTPLRLDLEPCTPTILGVNRQLHDEGIHVLYTKRITPAVGRTGLPRAFDAILGPNVLRLCSYDYAVRTVNNNSHSVKPRNPHIKSIRLSIDHPRTSCSCHNSTTWPLGCSLKACWRRYKDGISGAAIFLSSLRDVSRLIINMDFPGLLNREISGAFHLDDLTRIIEPFARLRGLDHVSIMINHMGAYFLFFSH
jgi:hypothetical protein